MSKQENNKQESLVTAPQTINVAGAQLMEILGTADSASDLGLPNNTSCVVLGDNDDGGGGDGGNGNGNGNGNGGSNCVIS